MKRHLVKIAVLIFFILVLLPSSLRVTAQSGDIRRAVDMMIVIDNSCSMFPKDKILYGCTEWGSDPDFLRVVGADLFIARLGFATFNENEYQLGVVGLGEEPELISPLQPLSASRDTLARVIANPAPKAATKMVPAIQLAYDELRRSPNRRPTNMPAVVLITDGKPYPLAGQTDADIERLISENSDITLFTMLLQDPSRPSEEYARYIQFWEKMQAQYKHVFVYRIESAEEIEKTYNQIVAQLQNTIPSDGTPVVPEKPLQLLVGQCVQKIIVTVIHESAPPVGIVKVQDSKGNSIEDGEAGIVHFRGNDNPIEVISISPPRLSGELLDDIWTISSDKPVMVFLDREGCYRVNFTSPAVSLTDVTNVYLATERHSPNDEAVIQFNLLDSSDQPYLIPQPVSGEVIFPDGSRDTLRIPTDLSPSADGIYTFRFNYASAFPAITSQSGRFTFKIDAGLADFRSEKRIPIASARVLIDVGPGPFIESINPDPILCEPGVTPQFSVQIADVHTAMPDSIHLRLFGDDKEVSLLPDDSGLYQADISSVCQALVASLPCSTFQMGSARLRMVAQLADGSLLPAIERNIPVQMKTISCTPTPLPPTATLAPTPTPTLTPIPDTDDDGFHDLQDRCVHEKGTEHYEGCPTPLWVIVLRMLGGAVAMAFLTFGVIPWLLIRLNPPPKAYVLLCGPKIQHATPKSIYDIGMKRRKKRVSIGGDEKKAHIHFAGLNPIEFYVEKQGDNVVVVDAKSEMSRGTLNKKETKSKSISISTSDPNITLRFALDLNELTVKK